MSRKGGIGIIALLIKLGPKLASLGKVLISGGKATKVGLMGASAAAYSSLFGWKVALMILLMLFLHEGGHLQAMKLRGMKVKGMYFIPMLGAAAVPDDDFPSREAEGFVALMGPTVGFILCIAAYFAYVVTGSLEFIAAIGWMAFVNLINLLPVMPLDGGRVLRSTTFSISSKFGLALTGIGVLIGVIVMIKMQIWLFLMLLPLGILEISYDHRNERQLEKAKKEGLKLKEALLEEIEEQKKLISDGYSKEITEETIQNLQEDMTYIENSILSMKVLPKMTKTQMFVIIAWTILLAGGLFYLMSYASQMTGGNFIQLLQ